MNEKSILIVDDSEMNRNILRAMFDAEYDIYEAENGDIALELLNKYYYKLDIVLLDVIMPQKNGYEVLDEIRQNDKLKKIPIIVITSNDISEVEVLDKGAWDYIVKPFRAEIVKSRVENAVSRKILVEMRELHLLIDTKKQVLKYMDQMPLPFAVYKLCGEQTYEADCLKLNYCNEEYCKLLCEGEDLIGKSLSSVKYFFSDIKEKFYKIANNTIANKNESVEITINNRIFSVYIYSPKVEYCACILTDITELRNLTIENMQVLEKENKLLLERNYEQERYKIIMQQTGAVVFEWQNSYKKCYFSDNIKYFEYNEPKANESEFSAFTVHPNDKKRYIEETIERLKLQSKDLKFSARLKLQNGHFIWCKISYNCEYYEGKIERVIGTIQDINNEVEYLNQLKYDAEFDALTGIYNKKSFFKYTHKKLNANSDTVYSLIHFNINNFKVINELFGHEEGDKLLLYIAVEIRKVLSQIIDSVYGRMEADMYCVLVPTENATKIVEILSHITDNYMQNFNVLPSIGIYNIIDKNVSIDLMCDRAKLAMLKIKGRYLERYAIYDENIHKSIVREQEIIQMMTSALEKKQFLPYYQPKYDLQTNMICGAEALARWIHPVEGMIYPNEFIPIFEKNGFIIKMDEYIWEQVCIFLKQQIDANKKVLPISVNISKVDLYNPNLSEKLISLIEKYEIPVELLPLELTESIYTENKELLNFVMKQLQDYGFIIMMDDFGSGYSSLNMLQEIPVNVLKIDLRFLSGENKAGRGSNILSSVIRMAKWLNLHVVTEGIETKQQADFLRSIGCKEGQGYYYAKPMPQNEFVTYMETSSTKSIENTIINIDEFNMDEIWEPNTKLSMLFNNMVSAIGVYEMNHGQLEALRLNDKYFEMIGYNDGHVNDELKDLNCIPNENKHIVQNMFAQAFANKGMSEAVYARIKSDGSRLYLHTKIKYVTGDENNSIYFAIINDVTKEREADALIDSISYEYKMLLKHMPGAVLKYKVSDKHLTFVSDNMLEMLGYTNAEFKDKYNENVVEITYYKDRLSVMQTLKEQFSTKNYGVCEYRIEKKDGELIWVRDVRHIVRGADGEDWAYAIIMDNTKQQMTEIKLNEINEELTLLFEAAPGSICRMKVEDGLPLDFANNSFYNMFGYDEKTFKEELNNRVFDLFYEEDKQNIEMLLKRAIKNKYKVINFTAKTICRNRDIKYITCGFGIIYKQIGIEINFMSSDITPLLEITRKFQINEQELLAANEALKLKYKHEKKLKENITHKCIIYAEIDLENNIIVDGTDEIMKFAKKYDYNYQKTMEYTVNKAVKQEDKQALLDIANRFNLLQEYKKQCELSINYMSKTIYSEDYVSINGIFFLFKCCKNGRVHCNYVAKNVKE
ncbi:MAG: EAL domain-containing protein [Clostridia bacterium]